MEKTGKKSENNSQHRQYYEEKLYTLLEKSVAIGNNKTDIVEILYILMIVYDYIRVTKVKDMAVM